MRCEFKQFEIQLNISCNYIENVCKTEEKFHHVEREGIKYHDNRNKKTLIIISKNFSGKSVDIFQKARI